MTGTGNVASDYDRAEQRVAAIEGNDDVAFAVSDDDAHTRYLNWREIDPFPDVSPALLNSADIIDYVSQTGLIYPFKHARLKSASYEVPLLGPYLYIDENGKRQHGVLKLGEEIRVRKNSITFLTVEPFFRLPDYIALRHNLKIDHVYKGLLVGTGPLIDPGFTGRISLPLHNLTENDYTFVGGEGVIWVEFTKLSKLPERHVSAPPPVPLPTRQGHYVPFPAAKTHDRIVSGYVRQAVGSGNWPESSTAQIARTANKARKAAKRLETLVPGLGIVGIVALFIAIFGVFVVPRLNEISADVDRREDDVTELQNRIADLETELTNLQRTRGLRPRTSSSPSPGP